MVALEAVGRALYPIQLHGFFYGEAQHVHMLLQKLRLKFNRSQPMQHCTCTAHFMQRVEWVR